MTLQAEWWAAADALWGAVLLLLAVWIIVSGLDDLFVDVVGLRAYLRNRHLKRPTRTELCRQRQARIAIFVPCWQEQDVIGDMLESNERRIQYGNYEFFVGVYLNDEATAEVVRSLQVRRRNVHLATCPHNGPTSKADCLNWIYQRMLRYESEHGLHFDVIVTHDAEDVIHPEALHWINYYSSEFEMVQVPVLPLQTPIGKWTHGTYCDEFAEYQSRDMPARQFMGAFVPSSGVGTGFSRRALDGLAAAEGNRVFEPVCLTEDYENGFRLRKYGARQHFVELLPNGVATREYFPQTFARAVRQRTRWVTGIALQTWDRHGWSGSLVQKYWLWRDRKGLFGNPVNTLANLLFVFGFFTAAIRGGDLPEVVTRFRYLFSCTAVLGVYRLLYRAAWSARHFGIPFALAIPVRVVWANAINSVATVRAVYRFAQSKLSGGPLHWVKTEHQYPSAAALADSRRLLGEILVADGYLSSAALAAALAAKPQHLRIGEFLQNRGLIDQENLYEALSVQHSVPRCRLDARDIRIAIARSLPARIAESWRVLPFKVEAGRLLLASPEPPTADMERAIQRFTRLEIRFHLITPGSYETIVNALL